MAVNDLSQSFAERLKQAQQEAAPDKKAKKPKLELVRVPEATTTVASFYVCDLFGTYCPADDKQLHNKNCEVFTLDGDGFKFYAGERPVPSVDQQPAKTELATIALIEKLNEKHFVSREGGKTYVYAEAWDDRMGRNVLHRSSFIDFQNYHLNNLVYAGESKAGEPMYKPLGEVWLRHLARRDYEGITLEPGKDTPGFYNLWRGFSVQPVAGSWKLMLAHIFYIICSGNDALYQYVLAWLATAVQKPGEQAEVALVLRGKRGTGKGMLGNFMSRLFGGNAAHITSSKYLTGNFNSHLRDVVFLFADEAFWAGDKTGESVLKGIITEPTLTIEGKGRDVVFVKNMLHILMASNNDWVVPAGLEERRFCVLDVSDERMQDKEYFKALVAEMETGGLAAMLHDLQNHDLSRYQIRDVPQTSGLFEQKLQSLDAFTQWWFHRLVIAPYVFD